MNKKSRKRIRVAQFIGCTGDGGAERIVLEYAKNLDNAIFDPIIIVRRRMRGSANDRLIEQSGIKIYEIYKHHSLIWKIIQKPFDDFYTSRQLLKILRYEHIDVLHVHLELLKFVLLIRRKIEHIKIIFTSHTEPQISFCTPFNIERYAVKKLIRENNLCIIALHERMKAEIIQMFQTKNVFVIHNGVDIETYSQAKVTKKDMRRQLGIPDDSFVIGHVGRFVEPKNHIFIISLFKRIKEYQSNAFLLLVGSGKLKESVIEELNKMNLQKNYMILSNRDDIANIHRAMDVFLFPSLFEGIPISLLEAQVSGIRCVISDRIPCEAIITKGNSMLSLADSEEIWCKAILHGTNIVEPTNSFDSFDIYKQIRELEKLYLS